MRDPIYQSLKNIKERHTYLENRQQRIDKRNAEIGRELKQKNEEKIRLEKLRMLGKVWILNQYILPVISSNLNKIVYNILNLISIFLILKL